MFDTGIVSIFNPNYLITRQQCSWMKHSRSAVLVRVENNIQVNTSGKANIMERLEVWVGPLHSN